MRYADLVWNLAPGQETRIIDALEARLGRMLACNERSGTRFARLRSHKLCGMAIMRKVLSVERLCLLALVLLAACSAASGSREAGSDSIDALTPFPSAARTILLLRHAEKDRGTDPALTERGRARAEELAQMLRHSGAARLVTSEFLRTRQTLEPLARALGVAATVMPAKQIEELAQFCRAGASGSVTVVCGHSNTIPALLEKLGAKPERLDAAHMIPDEDFTRLYVLTLPSMGVKAAPTLLELTQRP